jgi:preprotein translocase subunit SecB
MEQLPHIPHTKLESIYFPRFEFERMKTDSGELLTPELQVGLRITRQEGDRYTADIRVKSNREKPAGFHMLVIARLVFSLAEAVPPLSNKDMKQFLHRNSLILAWPYLREMISSATARMGLPPLFIGMLDVSGLYLGTAEDEKATEPVQEAPLEKPRGAQIPVASRGEG